LKAACVAANGEMTEMKIAEIEAAVRAKAPHKIMPGPHTLVAAVALILREKDREAETLLIKRVNRVGDPWSGQVALPGGRRDGSESLIETAIRETKEEVGIDLSAEGRVLGELDDIKGHIDAIVTPFVAEVRGPVHVDPNAEVASYDWVPLNRLERYVYVDIPSSHETLRRRAYRVNEFLIWGLTYRILSRAIRLARRANDRP